MASSLGRIALGIVGALLLAPFGLAAVGFAIGSAIGGFLFAPDGPSSSIEGPRLGDTDVQASSVGKIIPRHYGVTRTGGNVFWSGGLKETKTVEEQSSGGGKGGGGGGSNTTTTYTYSASFATALGRGPAEAILRIWADGKLIYDVTGSGNVQNDKYKFRFRKGNGHPIDPLIEESINRRLQGLDDINSGNGEQAEYKTLDLLIAEAQASADPRSALYATYLIARRSEANATTTTPKQYRFTPAYKQVAYLLFDDMPLEDFGNRIPNITTEIVWSTDTPVLDNDTIAETTVTELSPPSSAPVEGMGVDVGSQSLLTTEGTLLRRFSYSLLSESISRSGVQVQQPVSVFFGGGGGGPTAQPPATATIERVLCADANGNFIGRVGRTGDVTSNAICKIAPTSLDFLGLLHNNDYNHYEGNTAAAGLTYATAAGQNGARTLIAGVDSSGALFLLQTDTDNVTIEWGTGGNTFNGVGDGPMCSGGSSSGDSIVYWLGEDGVNWNLYQINTLFSGSNGGVPTVNVSVIDSGALGTRAISSIFYDFASQSLFAMFKKSGGGGVINRYDPAAAGTAGDPYLQFSNSDLTVTPPNPTSGFQRSGAQAGVIAYANGTDAVVVDLSTGDERVYTGGVSAAASVNLQVYVPAAGALLTWLDDTPTQIQFARLSTSLYSTDLASIITSICNDAGMGNDEFDVTDLVGDHTVRGYTIGRAMSGRKALENPMMAYFIDGIETDWTVKFFNRKSTPIRTIREDELGPVRAETGSVPWLEARQPEYDLPRDVSLIYTDVDRDYQQGSAHKKRTAEPSPAMYARKNQTIEMPMVFNELEARDVAERLLFQSWMSRDSGKGKLPWTHLDLDPTDVINVDFTSGSARTTTDRIAKTDVGANFEIDIAVIRTGDPVYTPSAAAEVVGNGVPGTSIITPVYSKMFVFDIPLLEDYHDTGRASMRYYTAVGSDSAAWLSAELYDSIDNTSFGNFGSASVDVTWGQVLGTPLAAPRALFTTDRENTITVNLSVDNGDVNSVTRDEILNNGSNRALIWNQSTGLAEIIQFQDVVHNVDGTVTLSTFLRGMRGTDYMVDQHVSGEFFVMLNDAAIQTAQNALALIGTVKYYKAVSRGSLISGAQATNVETVGRDLYPYAPGQVRREDDGTDLTIKWNRRTRIAGEWNMVGTGVETVPLNEDNESYLFYLLPNTPTALTDFDPGAPATYVQVQSLGVEEAVVLAADLSTVGYTLFDDINVAVYQVSAQVGRGFPRTVGLAP